tara:strand:+ start:332 stop:1195 length:864 start_codon:yes stop_codon:yes gene_type:complete
MISSNTQIFAVVGYPIDHSLSPLMHNASMKSLNFDGIYLALNINPDDVVETLPMMNKMGFKGINLTIPHKEIVYSHLEILDDSAKLFKSVNTILFEDNKIKGFNTDGYGFLKALESSFGKNIDGDKVFVLGCGGAGRTVALQSTKSKAKSIWLADIDEDKILKLKDEILSLDPAMKVYYSLNLDEQIDGCKDSDLIIQASPVGMKENEKSLFPSDAFNKNQRVFDLIYMYPETSFMSKAKESGASVANGLGMLLYQGEKAFRIWTSFDANQDVMMDVLSKKVYGLES